MQYNLFHNLQAFTDAWHSALSDLDDRAQEIFTSIVLHRETRTQIAHRHNISQQRVCQVFNKAITRFLQSTSAVPQSPFTTTVKHAQRIVDTAGIELALTLRKSADKHSHKIGEQLINIDAILPQQAQWALAAITLVDPSGKSRPSLQGMAQQVRQIARQHHQGITTLHLHQHLEPWHQTMAEWPDFDLALHIRAITGISPDPKTGTFHPIRGWPIPINYDPNLTSHYTTRALIQANRCLTIPEIVQAANDLAQRDGTERTYSAQQINSIIQVHKKFRWAGPGTYGLTSWDVGHSNNAATTTNRVKIADEIIHLLKTASKPMAYRDIKEHILKRFNVSDRGIDAAICRNLGKQRFVVHPDRTVTLRLDAEKPTPTI